MNEDSKKNYCINQIYSIFKQINALTLSGDDLEFGMSCSGLLEDNVAIAPGFEKGEGA